MSQELKTHGSPQGSVFGIINTSIENDENRVYNKVEYDTLNVGWEYSSSATPILPPTPTPTIDPLSVFSCSEVQVTGSVKCSNVIGTTWSLIRGAKISSSIYWTIPASPSNPVSIYGNGGALESLDGGETKYTATASLDGGSNYQIKFSRPSETLDYVKIKSYIFSGSNFYQAGGFSYCTGSELATVHVYGITGSYKYHSRQNTTQDKWSDARYFTHQEMTLAGTPSPVIYFGEVVGEHSYFSFPINVSNECGDVQPPMPPGPTPSGIYCQQLWIDYDYRGRASASWIDCDGNFYNTGFLTGTPYTTAFTACHRVDTLSIPYGVNFRFAECGDPDPRADAYLINARYNEDGILAFNYLDAYGNFKSVYQEGKAGDTVFGIRVGREVTKNIGDVELTNINA